MSDELKRCELEETESYPSENGWVHVLECSECGRTCEHVNGTYPRCPYCSSVNVLDENYEPQVIKNAENYKMADDSKPQVIAIGEKYKEASDDGVERSDDGVDSRETAKQPIGQSAARETDETAETDAAKAHMRDFDDSRERLEADAEKYVCKKGILEGMAVIPYNDLIGWLDRQAAITKSECQLEYDAMVSQRDYFRKHIQQMNKLIDKLTAERDKWHEKVSRQRRQLGELQEAIHARNQGELKRQWKRQVEWLTAERDEWKTKCETCEVAYKQADAERKRYSEQIDELFAERDKLKAERDEAVEAYDAHMAAHDSWHEAEDITYTRNRFTIYEQATKERIARLESERDALQAKLDALKAHGVTVSEPFCGGYEVYNQFACDWRERAEALEAERDQLQEQHGRQANTIERLTAERDRLRRFVDGGAYDCMTCEAKAELAERADSLEAELKRKQHVIDVQRDSFLAIEAENAELRRALDGASDALESI